MKKNRTLRVNAFLMMLLAGSLSFGAAAAVGESGLLPAAAAQQQPVKGTIVDVNGNPIPGASVMIPGTTTGTVTQIDGTFSLNVADGAKVEIACLGYSTVTVNARNGMKVVLHGDTLMLRNFAIFVKSRSKDDERFGRLEKAMRVSGLDDNEIDNYFSVMLTEKEMRPYI